MVKLSTERFLPGLSRVKISKQYAEYKLSKQGFSISSLWRDVGEGDGRWPPSKEKPPSANGYPVYGLPNPFTWLALFLFL